MVPVELLAEHPLFSGLDDDLVALAAGCAVEVHAATDEVLFRTGDPADRCYLMRRGRIALEIVGEGGERLVVDTVDDGGVVGLAWLVPPYRWYLDARAVVPTTALAVDATCLRATLDADPRLGYLVLRRLVGALYERMQSARVRLLDVYGQRT
ncbi:MAG: cyclic nucleotide-binding domain-containing protein [Kineosporiaceae bacterium]